MFVTLETCETTVTSTEWLVNRSYSIEEDSVQTHFTSGAKLFRMRQTVVLATLWGRLRTCLKLIDFPLAEINGCSKHIFSPSKVYTVRHLETSYLKITPE